MSAGNIFKMEMYKNFRNKTWNIIVLSLSGVALLTTILLLVQIHLAPASVSGSISSIFIALSIVTGLLTQIGLLAFYAFMVGYPYLLLSTDYSNSTLSLMVASGVNRVTYYFVKLLTVILSYLLALVVIFLLPFILTVGLNLSSFLNLLSQTFHSPATVGSVFLFLFSLVIAQLASIVLMFFVSIITRGKFWGIFVYIGISMGLSIFLTLVMTMGGFFSIFVMTNGSNGNSFMVAISVFILVFSLIEMAIFAPISAVRISKQDL